MAKKQQWSLIIKTNLLKQFFKKNLHFKQTCDIVILNVLFKKYFKSNYESQKIHPNKS